jgi:hypothetical protein
MLRVLIRRWYHRPPRCLGKWEDAMRIHVTVALSMLSGIGIGAVAVQGLHAQSKPMVYLVNEIDVTDPEKYEAEFTPKAQATVESARTVTTRTCCARARPASSTSAASLDALGWSGFRSKPMIAAPQTEAVRD